MVLLDLKQQTYINVESSPPCINGRTNERCSLSFREVTTSIERRKSHTGSYQVDTVDTDKLAQLWF